MATYAIGDVQGCFSFLELLLEKINFDLKNDTLWFAGDLINRGSDSLSTLRFIKGLGNKAIVVLGNHDLGLLAVASGAIEKLDDSTINDILRAPDKDELVEWLRFQPLMHQNLGYTMVHAGIPPQWTITEALVHAKTVEIQLQSIGYKSFLQAMFINGPTSWNNTLTALDKSRYILNALTRMCFCYPDGTLNLSIKGNIDLAPSGTYPWFSILHPENKLQNIIFGHWAALNGNTGNKKIIGLDTGCVWQGALTAMRLEDHTFYSVSCKTKYSD